MPDTLSEAVIERVLEFDGKTTGSLEAACKAAGQDFNRFERLFALAASQDTRLQIAATWTLRKLLELGAEMTAAHCAAFVEIAAAQTAWEAQLHIAQSVQFIRNEDLNAQQLTEIIMPWQESKRPFLRAWTIDALCHLAQQDAALTPLAKSLMAKGETDPGASVRARVRNLRKSMIL